MDSNFLIRLKKFDKKQLTEVKKSGSADGEGGAEAGKDSAVI